MLQPANTRWPRPGPSSSVPPRGCAPQRLVRQPAQRRLLLSLARLQELACHTRTHTDSSTVALPGHPYRLAPSRKESLFARHGQPPVRNSQRVHMPRRGPLRSPSGRPAEGPMAPTSTYYMLPAHTHLYLRHAHTATLALGTLLARRCSLAAGRRLSRPASSYPSTSHQVAMTEVEGTRASPRLVVPLLMGAIVVQAGMPVYLVCIYLHM